MRILIVEDEVTLNKTIAEGLMEFGYQTDTSESFKDAEYYIGIRNYDLVLTDWMLADGNGIDLIALVKQKSARTSVVVLSAKDDKARSKRFALARTILSKNLSTLMF